MTTISSIIPTHERESLLRQSLQSILNQTRLPDEILVVDNVPSPATEQLVGEADKLAEIPVRYLHNPVPEGPSTSRNYGATAATGDLLAFLDDDDLWEPDFLATTLAKLQDSGADMVLSWMTNYDGSTTSPGKSIQPNLIPADFLYRNPGITGSNFIIRKSIFDRINGFDQGILPSDDKDLIIRFLRDDGRYAVVPRCLARHRIHTDGQVSDPGLTFYEGKVRFYLKHRPWMSPWQRLRMRKQLHRYSRRLAVSGSNPAGAFFFDVWILIDRVLNRVRLHPGSSRR